MARPLLQIWRELNRDRYRGREPSSLVERATADMLRELSSPAALKRQMLARLGRSTLSPLQQAMAAAAKPKPLSKTEQMFAQLVRRQENDIAGRVLGTPRPISPAPPSKRKRKPGGGRHHVLTRQQIDDGIKVLHDSSRLPKMSNKDARKMLRSAGIDASDPTLDRHIIRPARSRLPESRVKKSSRSK
ncbi:hypothetical protein [Bradyrhizobium sp. JYMT SZCCT0428]|uniref:hypothetical protein n=1 Tax=Bradyrhizobium sp. JYMT SZCCT0428 TaxID=2807673 RepID=UPI001BA5B9A3|nr:hypothetical protein [Bradyrhizobium sp. JYMT SZCCT0428]MBR1151713.1 hypothetical protein [Bradyrhizobium sp. JYMT SZCCT0428]